MSFCSHHQTDGVSHLSRQEPIPRRISQKENETHVILIFLAHAPFTHHPPSRIIVRLLDLPIPVDIPSSDRIPQTQRLGGAQLAVAAVVFLVPQRGGRGQQERRDHHEGDEGQAEEQEWVARDLAPVDDPHAREEWEA